MAKSEKRAIFGLILSCWLIYTFSICMKLSYSASMVEIKDEYAIDNNVIASLPITLYYSFYSVIQFVLAFLITKINVKLYMAITSVISGLSFVSVFFYSPIWYLCLLFAVNGITLGAVWCGSVLVLSKYLSRKTLNNALLFMSAGFSAGNALSLAVSSLAMSLNNWRITFFTFGIAFLVSTLYFLFSFSRVQKAEIKPPADDDIPLKKRAYKAEGISAKPLLVMSIVAVFFGSLAYYGFTNWLPTILKSVFDLPNAKATFITTLFPVVVYLGPVLSVIFAERLKNDFLLSVLTAAIVSVAGLVLCYVFRLNIVLTVALIIFLGVFLRLSTNLFACLVPVHINESLNAGRTSAVTNASASVSAALSPFLVASILDASGNDWRVLFLVMFGIAAVMLTVCFGFFIFDLIRRRKVKTDFLSQKNKKFI